MSHTKSEKRTKRAKEHTERKQRKEQRRASREKRISSWKGFQSLILAFFIASIIVVGILLLSLAGIINLFAASVDPADYTRRLLVGIICMSILAIISAFVYWKLGRAHLEARD